MDKLTAKSSVIFIALREGTQVFRSVEEVPPALRRRLEETTTGQNAATILIADKRGREELARALQGMPSEVQSRLTSTIRSNRQSKVVASENRRARKLRIALEILIPFSVALIVWFSMMSR